MLSDAMVAMPRDLETLQAKKNRTKVMEGRTVVSIQV